MAPASPRYGPVRTGAVVLAALLTELVVIGAACNQWVTEKVAHSLTRSFINGGSQGSQDLRAAVLTYNWRFAPQSGDTEHIWLSQLLMILTVLVLTALLVAAAVRGPGSFVRAFASCWMAVIAATLVGAYVRGLVRDEVGDSALRITRAVFGNLGPNTVTMFAALVLGLAVALVGGIVAVATRGPAPTGERAAPVEEPAFPLPPEQPPAFFGSPPARPYSSSGQRPAAADHPTTRLGSVEHPTTQLGSGEHPTTQFGPVDQTARFPRPPDDDDIRG